MSRRILKDRIERTAQSMPRPFSAVIYDIPSPEYCRVLTQGGTQPVVAWFTRNTRHRPDALRIGNAVLCQFKAAGRRIIEVIGPGTVIPTPVAGSPGIDIPSGPDTIINGCEVLAIPELA